MSKVVNKKFFFLLIPGLNCIQKRNKEKNIQTGSLEGEIAV